MASPRLQMVCGLSLVWSTVGGVDGFAAASAGLWGVTWGWIFDLWDFALARLLLFGVIAILSSHI